MHGSSVRGIDPSCAGEHKLGGEEHRLIVAPLMDAVS